MSRLPGYLWLFAPACLLGLLLPLLSNALGGTPGALPWLLDLASHWQWLFLAGLALVALVLFAPRGLLGLLRKKAPAWLP